MEDVILRHPRTSLPGFFVFCFFKFNTITLDRIGKMAIAQTEFLCAINIQKRKRKRLLLLQYVLFVSLRSQSLAFGPEGCTNISCAVTALLEFSFFILGFLRGQRILTLPWRIAKLCD
jgi:hypothetical protein